MRSANGSVSFVPSAETPLLVAKAATARAVEPP